MIRHRHRLPLQEIDLPLGTTTIGRSLECNLTLDDPLISRCHARIVVGSDRVIIQDLGSRNGVAINGLRVLDSTTLRDGDSIRIGTQQLTFCAVDTATMPLRRSTGELTRCAICRLPYAREAPSCPACEATEQIKDDRDTLTEDIVDAARRRAEPSSAESAQ
jgi:pSer/pThr/pTyr-binding forkhead associated (FHA) protein